jgi:hypothetical protein
MPKQETIYPYEVTKAIDLTALATSDPTNGDIKLEWSAARVEDDGVRVLDLRGVGPTAEDALAGWRELKFEVQAVVRPTELNKVLPAGTDYRESTTLLLSVRCPSTRLRIPVVLEPDPKVIGQWHGDVHLRRHDVRSRVEIQGFLVRRTGIPAGVALSGNYARFQGATIGIGEPLIVQVDQSITRGKSPFRIRWVDFRAAADEWLKANHGTLFFLKVDGDYPELLLNSAHREFRAILEADPRAGINAALQKLMNLGIAQVAWMQLFQAAVASITIDETTTEVDVPEGWRSDVLSVYLGRMFPELEDQVTRLREVGRMRTSQDEVGSMIGVATTVTQKLVEAQKLFAAAQKVAQTEVEEVSDGASPVSA